MNTTVKILTEVIRHYETKASAPQGYIANGRRNH